MIIQFPEPPLDEHSFMLYAARAYNNPNAFDTEEFLDDLKLFRLIKRLIKVYVNGGELKTQLILNYIITIYNVFTPASSATRMLYFRTRDYFPQIMAFTDLIGTTMDRINIGIEGTTVRTSEINRDEVIVKALSEL